MDAVGLVNAMIANYAERSEGRRATTAADVLIHAGMLAWKVDEETATEVIGERLSDIRAARG